MSTRQELADKIKEIHTGAQSGVMSVVTEQGRSVSLRFFEGRITRIQSRGSDLQHAIGLLVEAEDLKFNFVESTVKEEPDQMPAMYIVELLEKGPSAETIAAIETQEMQEVSEPQQAADASVDRNTLKRVLTELALVHVGPIAELLVEQALANSNTPELIIREISDNIPSENDARNFRTEARKRIKKET